MLSRKPQLLLLAQAVGVIRQLRRFTPYRQNPAPTCTANCPVPPAAAVTNTVLRPMLPLLLLAAADAAPGSVRPPTSSRAREAVRPLVSRATTSGAGQGTGKTLRAATRLYSANPASMVATAVPGGQAVCRMSTEERVHTQEHTTTQRERAADLNTSWEAHRHTLQL